MRNQKENNVYSNEFYDHLYKLESKREGEHSWTSIVDANDPDLVWLNNYVKQHKLFDEYSYEKLNKLLNSCFEKGIVSLADIAKELLVSPQRLTSLLRKNGLDKKQKAMALFMGGYIICDHKNDENIFVRDKLVGTKVLYLRSYKTFLSAVYENRAYGGRHIYAVRKYYMTHPDIQISEEDLINNEVIRVA